MTHNYPKKIENSSISLIDKIVKSIKTIRGGKLRIEIQDKSAIDIVATSENHSNKINIDILEPDLFDILKGSLTDNHKDKGLPNGVESETSVDKILEKLDGAKEFIHSMTDKESTFQQQLDLAKDFAHILTENSMTLVLMRKGKEAIILGKEAKPTVSKIISGSDDLQIVSVIESSKLIGDINPEN
ncbi:MAG: hypothetical protein L0H55_09995 [Candidatus Nitrosocosmicus sp.]|nr:hypothetical protein [Candidatus Nitrosocosmicus sp.]